MLQDFGPYTIERKMAVGGMAEIYLAREHGIEGLERKVVLKRILPSYVNHPEFVTMFLDEARLIAGLSHPNIAQIFGLGRLEDSYYLVMEYVHGPTLGTLLTAAARAGHRGLPHKVALQIALQIGQALDYIHGRRDAIGRPLGIVHRDLNPANVMLSYDGAVKIIDFGIAKAATKVYETRTGVIKGTYGYMSPEQLSKKSTVDHRADVFALGVVLYEMCLGTHPFDASNEANIIDRLLKAAYLRPRELDSHFPALLDSLIARCLSVRADARPADVRAVINEIVRYMEHERLCPTMLDVAEYVHKVIPDEAKPAPLSRPPKPPEFGLEPSRTAPLPRAPEATELSPMAPDLGQILAKDEATVPLSTHRGYDRDGIDTLVADRSAAAREILVPEMYSGISVDPTATAMPRPAEREPRAIAPPPRRRRNTLRRSLLFVGSAALVLGVGVAAFVTARAISGRVIAEPRDDGELGIGPSALPDANGLVVPAEELALSVSSEPPGAQVYFDGVDTLAVTPASLPVLDGRDRVIVRIVLPGYVTQEREVLATAGEARFVLIELSVDAGAPDSGTRSKTRRRRPRRR